MTPRPAPPLVDNPQSDYILAVDLDMLDMGFDPPTWAQLRDGRWVAVPSNPGDIQAACHLAKVCNLNRHLNPEQR